MGNGKKQNLTFTSIGNSIIRKSDNNLVVNNRKLFSHSGGLGAYNIGTDNWSKAKEKQDRMQNFLK